jgi:hypothetical protein
MVCNQQSTGCVGILCTNVWVLLGVGGGPPPPPTAYITHKFVHKMPTHPVDCSLQTIYLLTFQVLFSLSLSLSVRGNLKEGTCGRKRLLHIELGIDTAAEG